jgi:hypothetical protein
MTAPTVCVMYQASHNRRGGWYKFSRKARSLGNPVLHVNVFLGLARAPDQIDHRGERVNGGDLGARLFPKQGTISCNPALVPRLQMRIVRSLQPLFAYLQAQDRQAVALPDALEA